MKQNHSPEFAIAISRETNKLVNIGDTDNGKRCNCYCGECEEDLIAVNNAKNVIKPHFRHAADSKCPSNSKYESYIHWVTKELFKEIKEIRIPAITSTINTIETEFNKKVADYLKSRGVKPSSPVSTKFSFSDIELKPERKIQVEELMKEEFYKTPKGDIKVDIVIKLSNRKLYVEPFFTSKIDNVKLEKIRSLDVSTISIDLMSFVKKQTHYFTIEKLKEYLVNDVVGKNWVYVSFKVVEDSMAYFIKNKLDSCIEEYFENNNHNNKIKDDIENKESEIVKLRCEIEVLQKELKEGDIEKILAKKSRL